MAVERLHDLEEIAGAIEVHCDDVCAPCALTLALADARHQEIVCVDDGGVRRLRQRTAQRIRDRLVGPPEGPRALYLCHGFCEVGALPLVPWLRVLQQFLLANPQEVVILVIEDYVRPSELADAFTVSRLSDLAYRGRVHPPWPTLGKMAASDQRVAVFLESGRPGVDWMHPAFESIQETPYSFSQPSQLSCAVHRGGTAGSLFQLNHWIDTPCMPSGPSSVSILRRGTDSPLSSVLTRPETGTPA